MNAHPRPREGLYGTSVLCVQVQVRGNAMSDMIRSDRFFTTTRPSDTSPKRDLPPDVPGGSNLTAARVRHAMTSILHGASGPLNVALISPIRQLFSQGSE